MPSQGMLRTESTESTSKKSNRVLHILGFIEFIFISICLLLLLLNQYLNIVVDDYSPAYKLPENDDSENNDSKNITTFETSMPPETSAMFDPTNNSTTEIPSTTQVQEEPTSKILLSTASTSTIKNPTTDATVMSHTTDFIDIGGNETTESISNHSKTNNDSNSYNGESTYKRHLNKNLFISNLSSWNTSSRTKRDGTHTDKKHTHHHLKTKLSNLLIMYPCCVAAMIILWMQMVSRLTNDIMFKSTMIGLIVTCIALGTATLAASIVESLSQRNSITILVAVSSAIFIILEIVDFILLFIAI